MSLQNEIDAQRKQIKADGYPISIGELASMYRDEELDIHPAFQRFFRWDVEQKSKWIESILLGIPTPSVFVAQRKDGVWDVVDGLQRLSTIFEFIGILRDRNGKKKAPLVLKGTKYLPSLDGKSWEVGENALSEDQRRFLKREKLEVKIVLRESDESSKYELFQRLNSGGSSLSDQELRNCMLVGIDESLYEWIEALSKSEAFVSAVPIPDRLLSERFDIELVLRFIVFRNIDLKKFKGLRGIHDFLTEEMVRVLTDKGFNRDQEAKIFDATFEAIAKALGDNAFRKYDSKKNRFFGPFLVSAYEIIAMGLGYKDADKSILKDSKRLEELVTEEVWSQATDIVTKAGESAVARIPRTLELGRKIFE